MVVRASIRFRFCGLGKLVTVVTSCLVFSGSVLIEFIQLHTPNSAVNVTGWTVLAYLEPALPSVQVDHTSVVTVCKECGFAESFWKYSYCPLTTELLSLSVKALML